jgi:hypothetical protein
LRTQRPRAGSTWAFRKQFGTIEVVLLEDVVKDKAAPELKVVIDPVDGFTLFDNEMVRPEMVSVEILGLGMHSVLRTFSIVPAGQTHTPPLTTWLGI